MKKICFPVFRKCFFSLIFLCGPFTLCSAPVTNINTNSSQATAANQTAGTTNVLLYYFTLNVTSGNAAFTSISNFSTSGTYVAADILNLKLWMTNFEAYNTGNLLATINTSLGPGTHTFNFANQIPTGIVQRYFWITADLSTTATCGHTIQCDLVTAAMYVITGTKNFGTNDPAGLQTILGGTCTPAPIELISFTGKNSGNNNILEWKTATETNNDFFTIERSEDAQNYEILADIDGAGNSIHVICYHYTDTGLSGEKPFFYYRLKQTDFDGHFSYSNVVALNGFPPNEKTCAVHFDSGQNSLTVWSNSAEPMNISIIDIFGKIVFQQMTEAFSKQPSFTFYLPLSGKGIYIARLSDLRGAPAGQCKFLE